MKTFRNCEIVQQIKYLDMEKIKSVLVELVNKKIVREYAYIVHDKDIKTEREKDDGIEVVLGGLKEPHIHLMLRFYNPYGAKSIGNYFEVPEQYVCKIKGQFKDALLYLTHKNAPEKYQYADDEVFSNFNVQDEINNPSDLSTARVFDIMRGIKDGVIREFNLHDYITMEEYVKFKTNIDDAFKYRLRTIMYNNGNVNRDMAVMYIQGGSGTGKSTIAKDIARKYGSVFVSSGSNDILYGYAGQDVIILDDLRASCLGLSDLLKLLDNNTSTTVKSRYTNKCLEAKLIIITTVLDVERFYNNVFENEDEPIIQFKRRCSNLIKVSKDFVQFFAFDGADYKFLYSRPNYVTAKYSGGFNVEKVLDVHKTFLKDIFGEELTELEELAESEKKEKEKKKEAIPEITPLNPGIDCPF